MPGCICSVAIVVFSVTRTQNCAMTHERRLLTGTKRIAGAAAALAVVIAVAGVLVAVRSPDNPPRGYDRVGPLGPAVVYAKHDAETVSVIVREGDANLCDGAGPLGGSDMPAVCDDTSGTTYVYIAQVTKGSTPPDLCETLTRASVPTKTLTTPDGWPVDFVALIRSTDSDGDTVHDCARLNAD
jgi:hypothetical protein